MISISAIFSKLQSVLKTLENPFFKRDLQIQTYKLLLPQNKSNKLF